MCKDCGCSLLPRHPAHAQAGEPAGPHVVQVMRGLLERNDREAAHNREHFDERGVLVVNLMSSPGSGKTRLLEATIDRARERWRMAVIEGDLETENDARRIRAHGVPAVQITTGTACHLDAGLVHGALHELSLDGLDILFIENVGNLVCPASFDLGQHENVTLLSVTEGDDKPAKYPVMFRASDLVLLTKTDLLPLLDDFSPAAAEASLRQLASSAPFLPVSTRTPGGIDGWLAWLAQALAAHRSRLRMSHAAAEPHDHDHDHDHSWEAV